jgi:hypothetical protein
MVVVEKSRSAYGDSEINIYSLRFKNTIGGLAESGLITLG